LNFTHTLASRRELSAEQTGSILSDTYSRQPLTLPKVPHEESGRCRQRRPLLATCAAAILGFTIPVLVPQALTAQDSDLQKTANKTGTFLDDANRGKAMLNYLHMGARYRGHEFIKGSRIADADGFELLYRFRWEDDGVTDLAFQCNRRGYVTSVSVVNSNAKLSPPFLLATVSIKLLGAAIMDSYKDKLTDDQKRQLQQLINEADAKGMLEWALRLEQLFSK
jgi:hypothetical protein